MQNLIENQSDILCQNNICQKRCFSFDDTQYNNIFNSKEYDYDYNQFKKIKITNNLPIADLATNLAVNNVPTNLAVNNVPTNLANNLIKEIKELSLSINNLISMISEIDKRLNCIETFISGSYTIYKSEFNNECSYIN